MDFTDLESNRSLVVEKTKLQVTSEFDLLLSESAATDSEGTVFYRPYYVAATILRTRTIQLIQTEGTTFLGPLLVADEFMRLQRSLDAKYGWEIPKGMETSISRGVTSVALTRA